LCVSFALLQYYRLSKMAIKEKIKVLLLVFTTVLISVESNPKCTETKFNRDAISEMV
jgi:hypothetical protein